jgi:hydroxymethylpyrimidine/phosphomethylpyrimidine kinase
MKRALTIAGSDSGGGAGIQADLKTFAAFGVYGTSAITALTAQNTREVTGVHIAPAEFVTQQIEAVAADAVHAIKVSLLRLARVVTPNVAEAAVLSGVEIESIDDMRRAAHIILKLGPQSVIVKGGHLPGHESIDLLVHSAGEARLTAPRLNVRNTHGTGCTFAAALAARLAHGDSLDDAARAAKEYVTGAMRHGIDVGSGHQPLGHFWHIR